MLNRIIFQILLVFLALSAQAQLSYPVDTIYKFIKENDIQRGNADWKKVDAEFHQKIKAAKSGKDAIKALIYVFEQMNDVHSQIYFDGKLYANYPEFDDSTLQYLQPLVARSNQQADYISTSYINEKYAYIQVPGLQAWGEKATTVAQQLSDSICQFSGVNIKGFIIDLRLNGGGQLSAMLSGLNLLLGQNYLGGGVEIDGTEYKRMEIKGDNFYINRTQMTDIHNRCTEDFSKMPVVILIGPVTRSSGSITAIAFKHRPNTWFIGEPTADGYCTGNDYFVFDENISMNLSIEFNQDRQHNIYKHAVAPDLYIKGGDNFDDLSKDEKIKAAVNWLEK